MPDELSAILRAAGVAPARLPEVPAETRERIGILQVLLQMSRAHLIGAIYCGDIERVRAFYIDIGGVVMRPVTWKQAAALTAAFASTRKPPAMEEARFHARAGTPGTYRRG